MIESHNMFRELRKEFEVIDFPRKQFIFKLIRNKSNVAYYYVNYILWNSNYIPFCKHHSFFRTCDVAKWIISIQNAFIFLSNTTITNNSNRMQWVGAFCTREQREPRHLRFKYTYYKKNRRNNGFLIIEWTTSWMTIWHIIRAWHNMPIQFQNHIKIGMKDEQWKYYIFIICWYFYDNHTIILKLNTFHS